jgi:hypothetical protein
VEGFCSMQETRRECVNMLVKTGNVYERWNEPPPSFIALSS